MKARVVFYLSILSLVFAASSALAAYSTAQLSNQIDSLVKESDQDASVSIYVKSMKYSDPLYYRNINQPMTPASTMKIMTAEAALLFLGPSYRFSTQLLTDAKSVVGGVLQGNLYVVLSGDPSLTYDDLVDLLDALRAQQIHSISGNVYIDNTAYDQRFYGPGWVWNDKKYCYGAPISASIINHNCPPVTVTRIKTQPIKVTSRKRGKKTLAGKKSVKSFKTVKSVWTFNKVVTDVPDYNRTLFKNLLGTMGVKVYGSVTFGSAPTKATLVSSHASKPLRELLTDMLKKSDNIIAGAIFKKMGQLYNRQPGSWENSSYAVSQILSTKANVGISGMRILDGSGLSPNNLATASQMMQVLDFAYHHIGTSYDFISALPIAGVDGTLKHRMGNIARKVRAKTGTISGVVSLTGYTVTADKEPLAFVIMINGNKGMSWRYRELEDKIVTSLTKYRR